MDYDFITTCNWTSTGTFTLMMFRGSSTNVATSFTLYYRKKGTPTWSSTTNGEINITSTGEWEVANDWNKSGNNVLTHSYYGITAINSCTNVYFNEATLGAVVGGYFLAYCWSRCSNLAVMPKGFNLPLSITSVGSDFLANCWDGCSSLVSMPEGFNLPSGIASVGARFLNFCWNNCTGLANIPNSFSLPSELLTAGAYFLNSCWNNCTSLKQDDNAKDLVFEFDANNVFAGTCPITPDSIKGASKANPVRVPVNRPEPPPIGPVIGEKYPLPPFKIG